MLRQLCDENQSEPAFAASLRDTGNLFEEDVHFSDPFGSQEFMCLFDDDQSSRSHFAERFSRVAFSYSR